MNKEFIATVATILSVITICLVLILKKEHADHKVTRDKMIQLSQHLHQCHQNIDQIKAVNQRSDSVLEATMSNLRKCVQLHVKNNNK